MSPEISVDFTAVLINSGVSCWHVEMSPVQVVSALDHYNKHQSSLKCSALARKHEYPNTDTEKESEQGSEFSV